MNLTFTPEQQAFRAEVRDWLHEHVPREPLASYDTREGFEQHRAWEAMLAEPGYSALNWPVELGGRGAGLVEWLIFEEEYWAADAPQRVNQNGILLLGPTLMEFGTPEQKARFLPRMARCEDMWAQGWSEPNAGSDMAAITSKAIRTAGPEGEHYVLNGQKIWSTRALFANWLFGLFRSDPSSSRHHGLSYLLVPLDAPGVTIRPIKALNGKQAFAEVFFDDVKVPLDHRIGEEGQGWHVAMATAGFERGLLLRSPARYQRTAQKLVQLYRRHQARADRDSSIREAVLKAWMDAEAYNLASYHTVGRVAKGATIGAEASTNKIFWSELDVAMHETAMRILGPQAELTGDPEAHDWLEGFMFAQAGPIYAGTNEIERMLGLPKG
jgi:alkylation response protein AidB-like acyl-CoA dehydrogenase